MIRDRAKNKQTKNIKATPTKYHGHDTGYQVAAKPNNIILRAIQSTKTILRKVTRTRQNTDKTVVIFQPADGAPRPNGDPVLDGFFLLPREAGGAQRRYSSAFEDCVNSSCVNGCVKPLSQRAFQWLFR